MLFDITPLKISRDYRLLFFGQLISFFGSMMTFIVVPWQMYQLTNSSAMVGYIYLAEFVPMVRAGVYRRRIGGRFRQTENASPDGNRADVRNGDSARQFAFAGSAHLDFICRGRRFTPDLPRFSVRLLNL